MDIQGFRQTLAHYEKHISFLIMLAQMLQKKKFR